MKQTLSGHVEESLATAEIALSEVENAEGFIARDVSLAVGAVVLALSGDLGDEVKAAVDMIRESWARESAYIALRWHRPGPATPKKPWRLCVKFHRYSLLGRRPWLVSD